MRNLLLGWILGFFGTQLTSYLKTRRDKKKFISGLRIELREKIQEFVGIYYLLNSNTGNTNREVINWILEINSKYDIKQPNIIKYLDKLLELTDDQLNSLSSFSQNPKGVSTDLKKIHLLFLKQHLSNIVLLKTDIQIYLFDILKKIFWINEMIDRNNFFNEKSFDMALDENNRDILNQNLKRNHTFISRYIHDITSTIIKILDETK